MHRTIIYYAINPMPWSGKGSNAPGKREGKAISFSFITL
jgi:hypothetical protein